MEITQNILLSLINFLKDNNNILNVKTINRITPEESQLPAIIIKEGSPSDYKNIEIGSKQFMRTVEIYFGVFALNDGERLEVKDKLITLLRKNEVPLYSCSLVNDNIVTGSLLSYMNITNMVDYRIRLGEDLANLDLIDRHRHLIIISFDVGKIE